jgi:hypothetical protein
MPRRPFNRQEHVYRNDAFTELVKDGVRFFNGTPVLPLPPEERFAGTGVYAIYYTGRSKLYAKYAELNRLSYGYPIYVGKAVPKGWRQARISHIETDLSTELHHRLREHSNSIGHSSNLKLADFMCRFVISGMWLLMASEITTQAVVAMNKHAVTGMLFILVGLGQKSARASPPSLGRSLPESMHTSIR